MIASNLILAIIPLLSFTSALPAGETSLLGPLASNAALDTLTPRATTNDAPIISDVLQQRSTGDQAKKNGIWAKLGFGGHRVPRKKSFPGQGRRLGGGPSEEASDSKPSDQSTERPHQSTEKPVQRQQRKINGGQ
ncbi:hypothetical protein MCOR25_006730 [Pyricularia grisea]|uniref:Uncharacterized protein n=1 Tax=Pyricularia grisea TaxID=148305 RepID=A0A6P8BEQ6_PYRGI|nr:uncharacterized protein PgNI_04439 [Pyricularia grisea]KAI6360445.1 hypothetical protein MCOR25_006730 [Pyricularia grisea]TLD14177.1 hypothetical protein PgNI_04439 [Pyricularia grisea]